MLCAFLLGLALPASALEPFTAMWLPDPASVRRGGPHEFTTRRFLLNYPEAWSGEHDRRPALHAAAHLDALYDFLAVRYSSAPALLVHAELVFGERGRSRTVPEENLVRTGADGTLPEVLGSFLHELVHLFNLNEPGASQDFWSGELYAQYLADRLETLGLEHRERYRGLFKANPKKLEWKWVGLLDDSFAKLPERERDQLMDLGVSVYYYLEDTFGAGRVVCFQGAHLDAARRKDPALWQSCFGKPYKELHAGWRKYYGLD